MTVELETLSHIAGILGLFSIIVTSILAWRKSLLNSGFRAFREQYSNEMRDFKTTIRDYIAKNDERYTRSLERIAGLYQDIRDSLRDLEKR